MNFEEIRKIVRQRPFKPFFFHLDNGQKYPIRHSDIFVSNVLIVILDEEGKTVMITPEAITSIEFMQATTLIPEETIDQP